jgi:hypothetical protein
MTLTIRIEENSSAYKDLLKVKDVFRENTSQKAILKAIEYTAKYREHQEAEFEKDKKYEEVSADKERILRAIRQKIEIEEYLKEKILSL